MSEFRKRLAEKSPEAGERRWLYVAYDQLSDEIGPLAEEPPESLGVVLIESSAKAAARPYHRQKLALVLANQRHFALEQAARGVAVDYVMTDDPYPSALESRIATHGPLRMMEAAERELRQAVRPLVEDGGLEVGAHPGWLTTADQFERGAGEPPWKMDAFYRLVRRESGVLMEDGEPEGGKFSFDADNRRPWHGEPEAPEPPSFEPDAVTREVGELIAERFGDHPGRLDLEALPATREDARRSWRWALERCVADFGPYEDAMSRSSRSLFHTRVSGLLNLHRLLPADLVREVAAADAPLSSREGFVRQVLGWREFVRHVHRATDGFRRLPGADSFGGEADGAAPSALDADWPLPDAYWGERSGLECLDTVVEEVWEEAYTHHIPRLMVLANLGTLLGVAPRELTDWFWVAFQDAFDWVVEPNVLGMGTFAVGDLFTTKPYVSGANYIRKMSDYCEACRFDPRSNCPITRLYWAFLDRHADRFASNPRMSLALGGLGRRSDEDRREDRQVFERVRETLSRGEELPAPEA